MTQADAAVVRRQIVINAPIEKAFTVFTDRERVPVFVEVEVAVPHLSPAGW